MRRFSGFKGLLTALVAFFFAPVSWALTMDQRLLSLVPPSAQIVAGMDSPPPKGQTGSFVLITHSNRVDLQDFIALTGADSTRRITHAVFVAMDGVTGQLAEHSLLASGHFDQARVYKSAEEGGATMTHYHDIPVLTIQPFAREQGEFNDVRWLAIPSSDVLLFGTIASVREELDRYVASSAVDAQLASKLTRMHRDDETWCVMSTPAKNSEIRQQLLGLDPTMAKLVEDAEEFQFGIRYHRQVEVEYEVTTASAATSHTVSNALRQALAGPQKGSSLLASGSRNDGVHTIHGVTKIPVTRFSSWLMNASEPLSGGKQ
jgi:hypothetical protein